MNRDNPSPLTAYLGTAEAVLPSEDAWVQGVAEQKRELLAKITSPKHRADAGFQRLASPAVV